MKILVTILALLVVAAPSFASETLSDQNIGLPVSVQEVTMHLLGENLLVMGKVFPSRDTKISSQYAGRIMRLKKSLGSYVKRNETIAEIRKKEAEVLHKTHPLSDLKIVSPVSGYISEIYTSPGEIIAAGQPVLRIVATENPHISLSVPGEFLHRIKKGLSLSITKNSKVFGSKISRVIPVTDPDSGTFQVLAPLKDSAFYPGEVCPVTLHLREKTVLAIPRSAIITRDGQQIVFVVVDGKAQKRLVVTGIRTDELIEIKEGLKAGEQVVSIGNYQLSDGVAVRVGH